MVRLYETGLHPFFKTSQHKTGVHPFYIGMYIHIFMCIYIYTSQKECLCIFTWVLTSHLSREDFVGKKGAMRKMKIYGPNFHIFSSISP